MPVPECGDGLWSQIGYLNMSDPSMQCPSEWTEYSSPARSCGRPVSATGSCPAVFFTANFNYQYSKVCGRVIGYTVDNIGPGFVPSAPNPDVFYLDGVSVTHGDPRTHIWSFALGVHVNDCWCSGNADSTRMPPTFVGDNFFCEEFGSDPLWDGEMCGTTPCCTAPPWFSTTLPTATRDAVEVRICADSGTDNENIVLTILQIYVR